MADAKELKDFESSYSTCKQNIAYNTSNTGRYNTNLIIRLNSLLYVCSVLNKEIENSTFLNKTYIEKEIKPLQSAGYNVKYMIEILCNKGYYVDILPKDKMDSNIISYTPNNFANVSGISQVSDIDSSNNYFNNYTFNIYWANTTIKVNHIDVVEESQIIEVYRNIVVDDFNASDYTIRFYS